MNKIRLGKEPYKKWIDKACPALEIVYRVAVVECREEFYFRIAQFKKQRAERGVARHDRPDGRVGVLAMQLACLKERQKRVEIFIPPQGYLPEVFYLWVRPRKTNPMYQHIAYLFDLRQLRVEPERHHLKGNFLRVDAVGRLFDWRFRSAAHVGVVGEGENEYPFHIA